MFNKSKGFTIIELLVVIAIIAVLAAIVLVNVTQYITKGKDAAARGNMATVLVNAAVYYDSNSNYTNFPTSTGYTGPSTALTNAGYTATFSCDNAANCQTANAQKFCAILTLKATTNTYCVDSSGNKLERAGGTCTLGVCS